MTDVHVLEATVTDARETLASAGTVRGSGAQERPRFELFHAAASICSQKVRAVLAHHGIRYREHSLNIFAGDTYLPGYVRLRMLGCESYGGALVTEHSGSTSVAAGGCDGAVVPTLVDWDERTVVVDSKRICVHLDNQVADVAKLRPDVLAEAIDRDLDVVDHIPNYQMLMGRPKNAAESARTRDGIGSALSLKKIAWCDRYLSEHPDDPTLIEAYTAKRAKEFSAAKRLFSPDAMEVASHRIEAVLGELERRLSAKSTRWLHGESITMADLFWGIELVRMENAGAGKAWQDGRMPNVADYASATKSIPAIGCAVLDWPGALF